VFSKLFFSIKETRRKLLKDIKSIGKVPDTIKIRAISIPPILMIYQ